MKDAAIGKLLQKEIQRQQDTVNLIPSENYVSQEILEALGSPLTNKYSEGYPGRRYYAGNEYYDDIERLTQERLRKLFRLGATWHVNVQPYSGSPANLAVYAALMNPGDVLMGLSLPAGGHLTHGHKVNFSGIVYRSIQYGVDSETGLIDYDAVESLATEHQPRVVVSGGTAYPRRVDFHRLGTIAKKIGAFYVADISHEAGLIAARVHPHPFDDADIVTSTTHKTLRGPRGAVIFCREEYAQRIDRAVFPGMQGGPHNNVIAAKAIMCFEAERASFATYQKQVLANAQALAKALQGYQFRLLTGGTDTHLMLLDMRPCGLDGRAAQDRLEAAGIVVNRNALPGDTSPFQPSGIRIGTPAATTRGMKERQMREIAGWMRDVLLSQATPATIAKQVRGLCQKFPLPYAVR